MTKAPATAVPGAKAISVSRGPASHRMVALTFDAGGSGLRGADPRHAARHRREGDSGMTGKWAEQNPDLVQRMVGEGHLLMNHTYDHASFTGYSPGTARR
ncbi:MAG: polysaccharide deacetylase family protein [Thermomicrobiales bacterium]